MDNPAISVIVPVFNIEQYLRQCISSLREQTYENVELLLVDDGSEDGSGRICDDAAREDARIRVIHQENSGLSAARNKGLEMARGEYLLFVDGDDYIAPDTCERLISAAKKHNCDIVSAEAYRVSEKGIFPKYKQKFKSEVQMSGIDFLTNGCRRRNFSMCVFLALYRREFITENGFLFEKGLLHEDELWTPQVYLAAQSVCYEPFRFYYHRNRNNSLSNSAWTAKRTEDIHYICRKLNGIFSQLEKKQAVFLKDRLCMLYLNALGCGGCLDGDKKFLAETAHSAGNRLKAGLYNLSPRLYMEFRSLKKRLKNRKINS